MILSTLVSLPPILYEPHEFQRYVYRSVNPLLPISHFRPWIKWPLVANHRTMYSIIHLLLGFAFRLNGGPRPLTLEAQQAHVALQALVQKQQSAMIEHRLSALRQLYALDGNAQEGLSTAITRSGYLQAWARLRRLEWTGVTVTVRTPLVRIAGPGSVDFYAIERKRYRFYYDSTPHTSLWFGIASRHYVSIGKQRGIWKFTGDVFANQVHAGDVAGQSTPGQSGGHPPQGPWGANRMAAVAYANRFCGNAPGCGNDQRYNPQYHDYNPRGGDCTNFISQVLFAGGIPMNGYWKYDHDLDRGTGAWVTAPGLIRFLRTSGHATLVAYGSYGSVTLRTAKFPEGAMETLRPGDVISYQKDGRPIAHSAVVVGYDIKGVPLVDTHTADRYQVPWDFGWPSQTVFYLWHVQYPVRQDLPPIAEVPASSPSLPS